ncbi:MAG: hypothetical protein Q7K71_03505 [Candidatus Omnitrophota bacterium]|nr:hypothetical protein [Candidatus Omnitrophota bacterium]
MNSCRKAAYVLLLQWLVIAPLKALNGWRRDLQNKLSQITQNNAGLQQALNKFLAANVNLWEKVDSNRAVHEGRQCVLVEALIEPSGYVMTNLVIARSIMSAYGLPAAGLLNKPNPTIESVFRSYGINNFYYLSNRKRGLFQAIRNVWKAVRLLDDVKNVDDFLNLKLDGISIGKIVYDNYLRSTGFGTLSSVSWRAFEGLAQSIGHLEYAESFFRTGNFPVFVQAEKQFIPSALVCQAALKHNVVIYSRGGGPTTFTLRRYDDLGQYYTDSYRPSVELFQYVYNNYKGEAIRVGEEHIRKRFSGEPAPYDIPDAALAFKKGDRRVSRQEFCHESGWDAKRPIVGIMANNLIDGVFTDNWELFRDYLVWFRETLKFIRTIDHVQWFIKPHPTDVLYKIRTTIRGEYERLAGDCKHIRFFPEDVAGSSVSDIVDVILTVRGSAGVEYSCFGIPCVIAGGAFYTGFGFTHEPKTQDEYFKILKNIEKLKRLSSEQIEKAKTFAYIYGVLSRVKAGFLPYFSPFADDSEKALWEKAAVLAATVNFHEDRLNAMIQVQVKQKYRHLLNYDWIGGGMHSDPCSSR